jgi:hypothetical protein
VVEGESASHSSINPVIQSHLSSRVAQFDPRGQSEGAPGEPADTSCAGRRARGPGIGEPAASGARQPTELAAS